MGYAGADERAVGGIGARSACCAYCAHKVLLSGTLFSLQASINSRGVPRTPGSPATGRRALLFNCQRAVIMGHWVRGGGKGGGRVRLFVMMEQAMAS
jgi:hypothetical protein